MDATCYWCGRHYSPSLFGWGIYCSQKCKLEGQANEDRGNRRQAIEANRQLAEVQAQKQLQEKARADLRAECEKLFQRPATCAVCQITYRRGERFCGKCGGALDAPVVRFCFDCSVTGADFCSKCGKALTEEFRSADDLYARLLQLQKPESAVSQPSGPSSAAGSCLVGIGLLSGLVFGFTLWVVIASGGGFQATGVLLVSGLVTVVGLMPPVLAWRARRRAAT